MKLRDILMRIGVITALVVITACEGADQEENAPPTVRRPRGAPSGEMAKANVSKVTYAVDVGETGTSLDLGSWRTGRLEVTDPMLDDRTHYDVWRLSGQEGERYVITMESADFDAYLMVAGPLDGNVSILAEDDDGAGATDARLEFVIPRSGSYAVLANSVFPQERGSYRIRIESPETTVSRPDGRRTAEDR